MTARIVLRTDKPDATEADVEQWAAESGCIVTNIRQVASGDIQVWTADVVISEGIQ